MSTPRPAARRRRWLPWVLVVLFVVVPLVEIYTLIQVGQVIGALWTVVLLVVDSIIGAWLVRREGAKAWAALRTAITTGAMPARELADAGLILVAGTLMLTPGFVSDVLGIFLVLPLTRPIARRALTAIVTRRLVASAGLGGFGGVPGAGRRRPGTTRPGDAQRPGPGPEGPVVRGEVVDEP